MGTGLPGSLLLLDEAAGDPLRDAPTLPPFCCPSLSTPVKNRELQSLPFIQVAENGNPSTIVAEHKRAVFSFLAPHGSG